MAALRVLAKRQTEKLFWIDAICINQADNAEKNLQVQVMKLIYQRAEAVLIWMNSLASTSGIVQITDQVLLDPQIIAAIKGFAKAHREGHDTKWLARYLDGTHDRKEYTGFYTANYDKSGGYWPVLVKFFDQDWWRRVWVRQEIATRVSTGTM